MKWRVVMHILNNSTERIAQDIKALLINGMQAYNLKEETIADVVRVDQSTVSRWLRIEGPHHFPVFAIAKLAEEPLTRSLGIAVMDMLETVYGREAQEVKRPANLNGNADDELLAFDVVQAEIIKAKD